MVDKNTVYQAVKSGKVKLNDLTDDYKREYYSYGLENGLVDSKSDVGKAITKKYDLTKTGGDGLKTQVKDATNTLVKSTKVGTKQALQDTGTELTLGAIGLGYQNKLGEINRLQNLYNQSTSEKGKQNIANQIAKKQNELNTGVYGSYGSMNTNDPELNKQNYLNLIQGIEQRNGLAKDKEELAKTSDKNNLNKALNFVGQTVGGVGVTLGTGIGTFGAGVLPQVMLQTEGGKTREMFESGDASSLNEARAKSLPYAAIGAGIESVSGYGKLGKWLENGGMVKNAIGEGLEEVYENIADAVVDRVLMKEKTKDTKGLKILYSNDDENSIINFKRDIQAFLGGALGGAIYGAVGKIANKQTVTKTDLEEKQKVSEVVKNINDPTLKKAIEVYAKQKGIEDIQLSDVFNLYLENEQSKNGTNATMNDINQNKTLSPTIDNINQTTSQKSNTNDLNTNNFSQTSDLSKMMVQNEENAKIDSYLDTISKKFGTKIVRGDLANNINGQLSDGKITLNKNLSSDELVHQISLHELTHRMQEVNSKDYDNYKTFISNVLSENENGVFNELIQKYNNLYNEQNNLNLKPEEITDELVADFNGILFGNDTNVLEKLAKQDRSLAQKIIDMLKQIVADIKVALGKGDTQTINIKGFDVSLMENQITRAENMLKSMSDSAVLNKASEFIKKHESDYDVKYSLNEENKTQLKEDMSDEELEKYTNSKITENIKNEIENAFIDEYENLQTIDNIQIEEKANKIVGKLLENITNEEKNILEENDYFWNVYEIIKDKIENNKYLKNYIRGDGDWLEPDTKKFTDNDSIHFEYNERTQNNFGRQQLKKIRDDIDNIVFKIKEKLSDEMEVYVDYSRASEDATYIKIYNNDNSKEYSIRVANHYKAGISGQADSHINISKYDSLTKLNQAIQSEIEKGVNIINTNTKFSLNEEKPKEREKSFINTALESPKINEEVRKGLEYIKQNDPTYQVQTNVDSLARAKAYINNAEGTTQLEKLDKVYNDLIHDRIKESDVPVKSILMQELMEQYQLQGDSTKAVDILEYIAEQGKKSGRESQGLAMIKYLLPEGKVLMVERLVEKYNKSIKEGKLKNAKELEFNQEQKEKLLENLKDIRKTYNDYFKEQDKVLKEATKTYLVLKSGETDGRAKLIQDALNNANYTADDLTQLAEKQAMNEVIKQADVGIWKKIGTLQTMAHLLNTSTAARNVLANEAFMRLDSFSKNAIGGLISQVVYGDRNGLGMLNNEAKQRIKQKSKETVARETASILLGVENSEGSKYTKQTSDSQIQGTSTFNNKFLNDCEKLLGIELKVPDEFTKTRVREKVLEQYKQDLGEEEFNKHYLEILEEANQEAKYVTFQDDSFVAKKLMEIKKFLNNGKDFGVGDLLLKYVQVPGNIISRGWEYSPIGGVKALYQMAATHGKYKNGEISLYQRNKMVSDLGRGITGTSLYALGYFLAKAGLFTSDDEDDENMQKLLKEAGISGTKANLSQFKRLLLGKADGNNIQDDDLLMTFDWLQPVSVLVTNGATIYNGLKQQKSATNTAIDVATNMLDLPCNQAISTIMNEGKYGQYDSKWVGYGVGLGKAATDSLAGFIPSVARHLSNAIDPTSRNTYSNNSNPFVAMAEQTSKKALRNIPGASMLLEPTKRTDEGNKTYSDFGLVGNMLAQASPTRFTQVQKVKGTDELKQLATNEEGKTKVGSALLPVISAPKKTQYETDANGDKIKLTDKDKTEYMEAYQEYYNKYYLPYLKSNYTAKTDKQKEAVKKKLQELNKAAKQYAEKQATK